MRVATANVLESGKKFLFFGGTETYLLFKQHFPLRFFCAFEVLDDEAAFEHLKNEYMRPILNAAAKHGFGLITDSLLWRASPDYIDKLGYPPEHLSHVNRKGVALVRQVVREWYTETGQSAETCPVVLAADLGPRGDGYIAEESVTIQGAVDYHKQQIGALAETNVDALCALSITSIEEAIGVSIAAKQNALPIIVSTTVETNGSLPDGTSMNEFINRVDEATSGYPLFYMVNCAYPTHFDEVLHDAKSEGRTWLRRFRGFRANASSKSHTELNDSPSLDAGDPADLAMRMAELYRSYGLYALGGCCGTDAEHLEAIAQACAAL